MEHPAGVGFSYCPDATQCKFDDDNQAEDNLAAVLQWYDKYPEYKENDLFIAGESYGGIYVPTLMNQVDAHNRNVTTTFKVPLKGIMVGNGVTNWKYDTMPALIEMSYWHSLIDTDLYNNMKAAKCDYSGIEFGDNPSQQCMDYLTQYSGYIDKINVYDIFGTCYTNTEEGESYFTANDYTPWMKNLKAGRKDVSEVPPCIYGKLLTEYFNRADVKTALYIPAEVQAWSMCADDGFQYTSLQKGS